MYVFHVYFFLEYLNSRINIHITRINNEISIITKREIYQLA